MLVVIVQIVGFSIAPNLTINLKHHSCNIMLNKALKLIIKNKQLQQKQSNITFTPNNQQSQINKLNILIKSLKFQVIYTI